MSGVKILHAWSWGDVGYRARLVIKNGHPWLQLGYRDGEWIDANPSDGVIASVNELARLRGVSHGPTPVALPDSKEPRAPEYVQSARLGLASLQLAWSLPGQPGEAEAGQAAEGGGQGGAETDEPKRETK